MTPLSSELPRLPVVGRSHELLTLRRGLERTREGEGSVWFLSGPDGVGKSCLARSAAEEAERQGFLVARGCAFPMESGVPYSIFCDLLDPLVRDRSDEALVALTRGSPEFQLICPSLVRPEGGGLGAVAGDGVPDLRNRLLWNLPPFLDRLRRDQPLLLILEDLEWADPSSLELLHFLGRQVPGRPLSLLATFSTEPRGGDGEGAFRDAVQSLVTRSGASILKLGPLAAEEVEELVSRGFGVDPAVIGDFARALHHWTGGNPHFIETTLSDLLSTGRLRREGGRWVGWSLDGVEPPGSIRELVRERVARLEPGARELADWVAVLGPAPAFHLVRRASDLPDDRLLGALEELARHRILHEVDSGEEVILAFRHPVVREVIYGEIGPARVRMLHERVARVLEEAYGEAALLRADQLAHHFVRAGGEDRGGAAFRYLAAAGRNALAVQSNAEAAAYLRDAWARFQDGARDPDDPQGIGLLMDLGRAEQRLGHFVQAEKALTDALHRAEGEAPDRAARVQRRLGLVAFWGGRVDEALHVWQEGLERARQAGRPRLEARFHLDRSAALREMGRRDEAEAAALAALALGEDCGDPTVKGAAHRMLLLLHTWTGNQDKAREHGRAAVALAEESGNPVDRFAAHWAMAVLEGLSGHPPATRHHLDRAGALAGALDSPLLRLQVLEVEIEYAHGLGLWERGVDMAQEAIRMARELNQLLALPRLLVWSGLLHMGRGEMEPARREIQEAWGLTEGQGTASPATTHGIILAHLGMASLHLAEERFSDAIRVGEAGMERVDEVGYTVWAIHRLLPTIAEASLHLRDLDRATRLPRRLRSEAERFGHRPGLIWADACDGLVKWLQGDVEGGAAQMAAAADRLEALADFPEAARLRRQLAGRLAELGDRDAAVRELRRVHDRLAEMGAEPELNKARGQFREVGARPPSRSAAPGVAGLTAREFEIARLVGARKSNKAIARTLGISPRTVGTHLSNIFRKLEVGTRVELGDRVRAGFLERGA
jgi:DNA-binding CsgD family transcriptional regulator